MANYTWLKCPLPAVALAEGLTDANAMRLINDVETQMYKNTFFLLFANGF